MAQNRELEVPVADSDAGSVSERPGRRRDGAAKRVGSGSAALTSQAAALDARSKALDARERALAAREAGLDARIAEHSAFAPAWSVPAGPAARQILNLMVETGDELATVARGIGVEPEWAAGVVSGAITDLDLDHVQRLCEGLHCTPYDLFGASAGRSIAHAYGPELWPRYVEPLEPLGWSLEDFLDAPDLDPDVGF
jgi:hypothetical protein